jgi:16S rRNA A1518/A1519 N6-dimethyltransferase RsmA/KsgA/DIM1 with predicted DNA glycosylase/AP lyase activity
VSDARRAAFRRVVVGLFGFRRKQLQRGIRELTGWTPDRALAALSAAGLDPTVRPETVAPEGFVALLGSLVDGGWTAE